MRKLLRIWLALSLLSGLVLGCGKDSTTPVDTTVAVKPGAGTLGAASGSIFVAVTAQQDWTLEVRFQDAHAAGWASVTPRSGSGNKADVVLRYEANENAKERSLVLVLTPKTGSAVEARVYQEGKSGGTVTPTDPVSGTGYGNGYAPDVTPAGLDWLELPATISGDGRELLIHRMDGQKYRNYAMDGTRNYTAYWDYKEHMSLWVAYPLNKALYGSGKFGYDWGFDPIIPQSIQPDITTRSYGGDAFGGGKWNRGHQMARADRQISQEAVSSTCYPTNATPQDGTFNSNIWSSLEGKVRDYMRTGFDADTLFVVTGCLFDQSTTYTDPYQAYGDKPATGFAVKIPTHYFKALLYVGHNSQEAREKDGVYYKAAAYFLPHDTNIAKDSYLKYICSIDELEQKTGIDFFPNLVGRLGQSDADAVEAAQPGNWWK